MNENDNKNNIIMAIIIVIVTIMLLCSSSCLICCLFCKLMSTPEQQNKPKIIPKVTGESRSIVSGESRSMPNIKPEVKPEIKSEITSEIKPEVIPEVIPEVKPETKYIINQEIPVNSESIIQPTYSTITNALQGNYCLDIKNQSTADNVNAIMHDCIGNTNELFTYMPSTKQIIAKNSGKCLSFNPSNIKNQNIVQNTCLEENNAKILSQQFDLIGNTIKSSTNNLLCLDVKNSGTKDGTNVRLSKCNGTNAQKWFYNFNGKSSNPSPAMTHPTTQYAETK